METAASAELGRRLASDDQDAIGDAELAVYEALASRIMLYRESGAIMPNYPECTEVIVVQSRTTFEYLGLVGRLGHSESWVYDDRLPGERGKGRTRSRDEAIVALAQAAGVDA